MENKKLHILINKLANEEEFADWGIATLSLCSNTLNIAMEHYSRAMENGDFAKMGYLYNHLDIKQSPELLINNFNISKNNYYVIAFLASYNNPKPVAANNGHPKIAQYAMGKDYHIVLKQRLQRILGSIKETIPEANGRCFTDSAPVMERAVATACGLGAIGKNGFLISRKAGVKTLLSEIILELPKESTCADNTEGEHYNLGNSCNPFSLCGECHRCMDACPTGALYKPGRIDAGRCISYQTIENRKEGFPANLPNPHKYIFGCDSCLNACPWNGKNSPGMDELVNIHPGTAQLIYNPKSFMENITKTQFNKIFSDSPIGRAGKDKILNTLKSLK